MKKQGEPVPKHNRSSEVDRPSPAAQPAAAGAKAAAERPPRAKKPGAVEAASSKAAAIAARSAAFASARWPVFLVMLVAVLMRLMHLAIWRMSPMFQHPELDPRYYDEWGQRIAGGDWLGSNVFEMSPLYAYFLGVMYAIFGHDYVAVCFVQAILGAATCGFVWSITKRLFGPVEALIAGMLAAVYPVFLHHDLMLLKTSMGVFLATSSLWFLLRQRSHFDDFFAGLLLGAAALVQDIFLLPALLLAVWCLLKRSFLGRGQPVAAAALVLGVAAAILPVTFRNYVVSGETVLTTSGGGEVFYVGNNEESIGLYKAPPFVRADTRFEHEDFRRKAREMTGEELSYAESSRYWFRQGTDFLLQNPGRAIALYLRKLVLFFNRVEVGDNYSFDFNRGISPMLRVPLDYGMLVALAAVGVFVRRRDFRRFLPLLIFFGGYFAGMLPFFLNSRYRMPLVPVLLIFSGVAVVALVRRLRGHDWKGVAAIVFPAATIYLVSALPLIPASYTEPSNSYEKLGVAWLADGKPQRALDPLEKSAELAPSRDSIHFNLGLAHERLGNSKEAIAQYDLALRLNPDNETARTRLATVRASADTGLLREVDDLRAKLSAAGADAIDIHLRTADAYSAGGAHGLAIEELKAALADDPSLDSARLKMAVAYSRNGQDAQGLEIAEEVLRRNPGDTDAVVVQTGCLMGLGRLQEAREHLLRALAVNPELPVLDLRLGQIARRLGDRDEALRRFRDCLAKNPPDIEAVNARRNIDEIERGR